MSHTRIVIVAVLGAAVVLSPHTVISAQRTQRQQPTLQSRNPERKAAKQSPARKHRPQIVVAEPVWDAGVVFSGPVYEHDFVIRNATKGLVRIAKIGRSCKCTAVLVDRDKLAPGDCTTIRVKLYTAKLVGEIERHVTITFEPETVEPVTLGIRAELIREGVSVVPKDVNMGTVRTRCRRNVKVQILGRGRWVKLRWIERSAKWIRAWAEPVAKRCVVGCKDAKIWEYALHIEVDARGAPKGYFVEFVGAHAEAGPRPYAYVCVKGIVQK